MTGPDVIAAGISLSVSGLWHRLCSVAWCGGVPGPSRLQRGDGGEVGAGLAVRLLHVDSHHLVLEHGVPGHHAAARWLAHSACRDTDGIPCRPAEQGPV